MTAKRTRARRPTSHCRPNVSISSAEEWTAALAHHGLRELSPFQAPESKTSLDAGGRTGRDFAPERAQGRVNVFEAAAAHVKALQAAGKRVVLAAWSEGSAERIGGVLSDHGMAAMRHVADWPDALKLHAGGVGVGVLGLEHGFEAPDFAIVAEQDILGDRMVRTRGRSKRAQNFLAEASSLAPGDLVTHIEHGDRPLCGPADDRRDGRAARLPRTAL